MKTILDVSNVVYGGYYGSPETRVSGFPTGGIRKVFGIINSEMAISDFILCFDGGTKFRKELSPQYKAGRVPNYAVMAQIDLLKELLTECNIPYLYREDFEADDLICSSVHFCQCVRDPDKIIIYSDDRDLSCCVSDDVSIKNVTSNGISINRNNFERRVVRGEDIPYNTILLHKMMFGDKSDNYPGVNITGLRFVDFALALTENLQPLIETGQFPASSWMDVDVINLIIDSLPGSISTESKEALKKQAQIVFPRLVDITSNGQDAFNQDYSSAGEPFYTVERRHIPLFGQNDIDQKKFGLYCSVLGLNRCRTERYGKNYEERAEQFRAQLKLRAKELSSGVMAVERYRHGRAQPSNASVLENMQLPI